MLTVSLFAGMSVGGTITGSRLWNNPLRGLGFGIIHGVITIAAQILFGMAVSLTYLAGVVIYTAVIATRGVLSPMRETAQPSIPVTQAGQVPRPKIWSKHDLIKIADGTLEAISQGGYVNSQGERQVLQSGNTLSENSQYYNIITRAITEAKYTELKVSVVNQDCLQAAQEQVLQGDRVAVVMFGSPIEPGGGFTEGIGAQEEELCYRSEIAGCLVNQIERFTTGKEHFYPLANRSDGLLDRLIHTPDVTVFRGTRSEDYAFLDSPFKVGMLIIAASVRPPLKGLGTDLIEYENEEDEANMRALIISQLFVAYEKGYDTVILGAFGCGAFKHPPQAVAKLYDEVIQTYFQGAFKKIIFAIVEDSSSRNPHNPIGNVRPFQEVFGSD